MRLVLAIMLGLVTLVGARAQGDIGQPLERYKIPLDLRKFPQSSPEETLGSVVQCMKAGDLDYLLAHLSSPDYVDARVASYARKYTMGSEEAKKLVAFNEVVQEIRRHFRNQPDLVQELRQLAEEGLI